MSPRTRFIVILPTAILVAFWCRSAQSYEYLQKTPCSVSYNGGLPIHMDCIVTTSMSQGFFALIVKTPDNKTFRIENGETQSEIDKYFVNRKKATRSNDGSQTCYRAERVEFCLEGSWPFDDDYLSAHADSPETPHLAFVKLYIEQLGAVEEIRDAAAKELKTDPDTQRIADCVHTMTQYQLELSTQISAMQNVHLNKPLDWLPAGLVDYNKQKLYLYEQYDEGCATMLAGPKPGVDYGKIAASFPKINAQVEFIDKGIFNAAPAVFASLIDRRENSHGGDDHLIITKAERDDLVHQIKLAFGDKLNQHDQNSIVSAASVLDFYLEKKGYKTSDEPWD